MKLLNKQISSAVFKNRNVLLFVLIFALIGCYVLARSLAASTLVTAEAESFSLPPGASIVSDSTASGGKAITLTTNGTATGSIATTLPADTIMMTAKGVACKGSPAVQLWFDGSQILNKTVSSVWATYSVSKTISAGQHNISLVFANDYQRRNCSRSVSIDKITLSIPDTTSSTTTPSSPPISTAPAPSTGPSWTCGWGGFKAGTWPTSCWCPYGDSSPWNQPLPASPKLNPNSAAIVSRTLGMGGIGKLVAGDSGTTNDFSHPTYYSQSSDPVFTIHCTEPWGTCAVEGLTIHIPDQAKPAAGGDGHMAVVDQSTNWEYDFWQVTSKPAGGGTLSISWGGKTKIDGDGLGSDATAARFGNLAGIIRAPEMQAGVIPHALFLVIKCGTTTPQYVYPALKGGSMCADITNAPPMGARFFLAMSDSQINSLAVPTWKKTILTAMAHYGMYFGDTGGSGFGIEMESGSTYTSFGATDPMVSFAQANGWSPYNGTYVGDLGAGVDWASYLRVADPCVAQQTCTN